MIAENVRWAYFQLSKFGWVGSVYFSKNTGSEQTSNDLKEIIPAAYHGRGGVYLWS